MTKRIPHTAYTGNRMYGGGKNISAASPVYCWGCLAHRLPEGGKWLGRLKLFHCVACVTAKENRT